jgi:molybdopterin converting factor small subunit
MPAMKITVHLHTVLQRSTPEGLRSKLEMDVPDGTTIGDVYTALDLTLGVEHLLLMMNGKLAELDQPLADGDEVHFIPAMSGGYI